VGVAREREQLEQAIAAQEKLRGAVPDDVVDAAIAALRAALDGSAAEPQRRRQVTVLFADVSGFTTMSEQLDPETVASTINDVWRRLDEVIEERGGRIDKHIGDAVMALWGSKETSEDDPEQAVRAGLAMQHELERTQSTNQLRMRVGISTGPVHLGSVGQSTEFTAIGDTVNVASRVEAVAPVGGVLVTHDTYRHVRGVFDVDALEPVRVKGKAEPIRVYLVRRAKERAFRMETRGVEGVETRTIGRASELCVLETAFEEANDRAGARLVTISGDPGVGKSRLLYEFENWIDLHADSAWLFKGKAVATRRVAAFGLMRDLFGDRFGVLDSDPPDVVAAKVRAGLSPALTADEADVVGHWLGFDLRARPAVKRLLGSGQLGTTARAHLFRYFNELSSDAVVVMFLEDLHWADDESLSLVRDLVAELHTARLLVVGVARSSPFADRADTMVHLEPLDADATRLLVNEVLQNVELVPPELAQLIVNRSEGNAFYVEELVKMLIDDGVIETGSAWDPWRVNVDQLDQDRIPATLTGILQCRVDGLDEAERLALQRASVVGRVFWDGTVASLGDETIEQTVRALDVASARELLIKTSHSSFAGTTEYTFTHGLLRDVTYETVLLRDRQRLHGLVAAWLTDHAGDRLTEYAGQIATHHRLAGDLASAASMLYGAAAMWLDAGNFEAARRGLEQALDMWSAGNEEPDADPVITLAETLLRLGDIDAAGARIDDALTRAASTDQRVRARYIASWIAAERGDTDRERALLDDARPEAETIGGDQFVRVLCGLAWSAYAVGEMVEAQSFADQALQAAGDLDQSNSVRTILDVMGAIAVGSGDYVGSLRHSLDALALAERTGDLDGQADAHTNIGVAYHMLGDRDSSKTEYALALEHYGEAETLHALIGQRVQLALAHANEAQIHVRLGDDDAARDHIRDAAIILRDSGSRSTELFCVLVEADRRLSRGETEGGLELVGVVQRDPGTRRNELAEIDQILDRARLAADVVERGTRGGRSQGLDDALDDIAQP
jgi:class 3 adenylate cyclase/tetratricopeptide (TPR) repeat protein